MAARSVKHLAQKMFYIPMADNSKCVLEYNRLPGSILDMYHTEVPPQHRGQGLAEQLVKEAFNYCKENNLKVKPTCSYVDRYARELATEEEKKLVVKSIEQ
ncbi:GNAT domain containing protein [Aphelenchoides avenae]|nr:GNAT domain containing protein [Aphelenchus avenae]